MLADHWLETEYFERRSVHRNLSRGLGAYFLFPGGLAPVRTMDFIVYAYGAIYTVQF